MSVSVSGTDSTPTYLRFRQYSTFTGGKGPFGTLVISTITLLPVLRVTTPSVSSPK